MTSEERREARYRRRVAARQAQRAKVAKSDDFERVFSFDHLYHSYRMSRKNVAWKASVQRYIVTAPLNVLHTYRELHSGRYKSPGFFEFDIFERGKARHIRSTGINERVVQRCLCDYALVPVLERSLIYDNGACRVNKGYDFALNRLTQHLREHYRKHGNNGYILVFDFSKFFDNVSHEVVKRLLAEHFTDERILNLVNHFIDMFGEIGLGLGSQISQILALSSANRLDHFVKEQLRIRGYGRYSDDGYLIHPSREYLKTCLEKITAVCSDLGIKLNVKKTQILPLKHGFTWLKARIRLTETGKVVRKIYRRSVTKMRQKLKKLHKRICEGRLDFEYAYTSWQSWKSYAERFDAWHTIHNMGILFNKLFIYGEERYVYQTI